MKRKYQVLLLMVLAIFALVAARMAISQPLLNQPKSNPFKNQINQLVPLLQEVSGYKLPKDVEARPVSSQELVQLPEWELKALIAWKFPNQSRDIQTKAYNVTHHLSCQMSVARHVKGTNIILVASENQKRIAKWDKSLHTADSPQFLTLALAHELALYVLESKYQLLDKKYDPDNLEDLEILQALREGHAQWITWQIAQRLGLEAHFPLLANRFLHVPDHSLNPQLQAISQKVFLHRYMVYLKGFQFCYLLDRKKREALGRVFANLPRNWQQIESPDLYLEALNSPQTDIRSLLLDIEKRFSPPKWQPRYQSWTPKMVQQVANTLGMENRAQNVLVEWEDGRSLLWTNPQNPGQFVALTLVRFRSEEGAQNYYGLGIDLQRERDKHLARPQGASLRLINTRNTSINLPGVKSALRNDKTLQVAGAKQILHSTIVLAQEGDLVVELSFQDVTPDEEWMHRVVEAITTR